MEKKVVVLYLQRLYIPGPQRAFISAVINTVKNPGPFSLRRKAKYALGFDIHPLTIQVGALDIEIALLINCDITEQIQFIFIVSGGFDYVLAGPVFIHLDNISAGCDYHIKIAVRIGSYGGEVLNRQALF